MCGTDGQKRREALLYDPNHSVGGDTSDVIDALRKRFPKIVGPRKMTSATPRLTVRKRYAPWQTGGSCAGGRFEKLLQLQPSGELAQRMGKRAFLIDDAKDIQKSG